MLDSKRSIEQLRQEFNIANNQSRRVSVLMDLLASIPDEDYQRILDKKNSFTWFIPPSGLGSIVFSTNNNLLYLSPELEQSAPDVVQAYTAHALAQILLGNDYDELYREFESINAAEEIAAWKQVIKWGCEKEIRKLKAIMNRRKTREGDLVAGRIATALGEMKEDIIEDRVEEKLPAIADNKPLALIIEDDKDSARLYSRILLPMGYDYQIVPDQETALARLDEIEPQMVILDMSLKKWRRDTAGVVILNKIRQEEKLKHTRVVVVTAYSTLADEVVNQVEGILIKPISAVKLKDLIEGAE